MASGSNPADAMAVCPCSMGTLGAIAHGLADNLIERAADVMLKERRPLILVPRETPLSAIHLDNMLKLAHAGAVILPPAPGFYTRPQSVADIVDFVVARVLDQLRVPHELVPALGSGRPRAAGFAICLMWPFARSAEERHVVDRQLTALPLFPAAAVLYPGGVLPLKVFEQRYIDMAKTCLKENRPFGVCLITQGDEVAIPRGATPEFAPVGTLARIVDFDMPQLGILHVATRGEARFQVHSHAVEPPASSSVEVDAASPRSRRCPLGGGLCPAGAACSSSSPAASARRIFRRSTTTATRSWVGYRLAELLPLPLHIKQSMLEINDAGVRLKVLQQFLAQQGLIGDDAPQAIIHASTDTHRGTPWPATANGRTSSTRRPRPTPSAARSSPASSRRSPSPPAWAAAIRR